MTRTISLLACAAFLTQSTAYADASYQETTQITGGTFVDTLRNSPFVPGAMRKLFDPINSLTLVHGNQMASISKSSSQIIDLDQEAVTHIDNDKKTYYVITFAEMREAMKNMPGQIQAAQEKLKQAQSQSDVRQDPSPAADIKVTFDVNVTEPGAPKAVNGVMSRQQFLTIKAHVTALNATTDSGANTITYNYITEIWTAPEPAEMLEVDAFYKRYAQKMMQGVDAQALMKALRPTLSPGAGSQLFAANPALGSAMSDMSRKLSEEQAKIKGVRILEVTRLGGDTMPTTSATTTTPPPAPSNGSSPLGSAVGNAAADAGSAAVSSATDRIGSIGGAFGRSLMGALKHNATPASTGPAAPGAGAAPSSAVLYETTTQKSQFSQESIPPAAFQVPAGYQKVDSPIVAQAQH